MSLIERAIQRLSTNDEAPRPVRSGSSGSTAAGSRRGSEPFPALNGDALNIKPAPVQSAPDAGPLETLDLESLGARGFVVPDGEQSELRSQFRIIKRPLMAKAFKRDSSVAADERRIMITSAMAGEGKSFCAINLALSMAVERDCSVMLVDADVARPSIPTTLGVSGTPGLMDALLDEGLDLATLVRRTNIDKFTFLPAGTRHAEATELLASTSMDRLLKRLSTRFPDRVLVFDSPPLLQTTEARVLASHMGQIVLVVAAGSTSQEAVKTALTTLPSLETVSLLLNKVPKIAFANSGDRTNGYGYYGY